MSVSPNASQVQFPRDVWGFTTALRKYGLAAAGSIKGDQAKHDLFLETLGILAQHAIARLEVDRAENLRRLEEIAGRPSRSQAETILPNEGEAQNG